MNISELKLADYVECLPSIYGYPEGCKFGGFIVGYTKDNDPKCIRVIGNVYGDERIHQVYVDPEEITEVVRRPNALPNNKPSSGDAEIDWLLNHICNQSYKKHWWNAIADTHALLSILIKRFDEVLKR